MPRRRPNKVKDKSTRRQYYLTHKADFARRSKQWRERHRHQLKLARVYQISVSEAGRLIQQQAQP